MKKPTFFILGAAKSGTTSLYYYLTQHPNIYMSIPKEPLFFEAEYAKGISFYMEKYFSSWNGEEAVGEARHRNLFLPYVPERIKETVPNAKLLVLVRNPVDRAYSHWWYWYSCGVEKRSFREAVEDNYLRIKHGPYFETKEEIKEYEETLDYSNGYSPHPTYIDSGYYADQIQRYIDLFGEERIKIIFLEYLSSYAETVLADVFKFLGLEEFKITDLSAQNRALSPIGNILQKIPGRRIIPKAARKGLRNAAEKCFSSSIPKMDMDLRHNLIEHYESHVAKLEKMTGRSLPEWRS